MYHPGFRTVKIVLLIAKQRIAFDPDRPPPPKHRLVKVQGWQNLLPGRITPVMAKRIARGTSKSSTPATRNAPAERPLLVESAEAAAEVGPGSSDGGYDSGNESPYDSEVGLSDEGSGSEDEGSSDGEEPDTDSGGSDDDDASGPPSDSSDDEFDAAAVDLLEASEPGHDDAAEPAGALPGDDERCA